MTEQWNFYVSYRIFLLKESELIGVFSIDFKYKPEVALVNSIV